MTKKSKLIRMYTGPNTYVEGTEESLQFIRELNAPPNWRVFVYPFWMIYGTVYVIGGPWYYTIIWMLIPMIDIAWYLWKPESRSKQ